MRAVHARRAERERIDRVLEPPIRVDALVDQLERAVRRADVRRDTRHQCEAVRRGREERRRGRVCERVLFVDVVVQRPVLFLFGRSARVSSQAFRVG